MLSSALKTLALVATGALVGVLAAAGLMRWEARARSDAPSLPPPASQGRGASEDPAASPEQQFAAGLREHAAELRDPDWAAATEEKLRSDLLAAATAGGFDLQRVECRAQSCTAQVRFASHDVASQSYGALLHSVRSLPCASTVLLAKPDAPAGPYFTTALFRCERSS